MKKFSIRFVSIILSLILVISSLPLTVLSVSAADGDTATTNLTASDVAYCGTGVGFDSSKNNRVRFPEQGYTAIKHCEFTFTGDVSGNQAVGTFSSDALGYTKYVNISAKAQQPLKTTAETLTVAFNSAISGTASIHNSAGQYLFFRDEEWGKDYEYIFDRAGSHDPQTAFSLFVRESGNTTSGINGYKRVQSINEIKPGEKYLIAHPGRYNGTTSNAADGSAWYVLHPSKSDENYVQVAKVYNTVLSSKAKRVQNGSFEYNADGSPYVQASGNQPQSHAIQAWNTTAEENKVELFNATSTAHMSASDSAKNYIPDGTYAAELNADEPGSLYQVVNTLPSSTYLWGLDHRGRSGTDTMALVIGPSQELRPSKNSGSTNSETTSSTTKKDYGKDQFMQMVEWAKSQEKIKLLSDYSDASGNYGSNTNYKGLQNITVYSKPFGLNGSFKSSDELSPFSLVPTDEHTEEWHIWIMTSGSGDWSSYGSNDEENGINIYGNINSSDMEKLKQFFYRVPAGQTESMFAFVPIDTAHQHRGNKTTLGNLLDNVNFEVFNSFTASSTNHGAGSLTDADNGHADNQDITYNNPISVYTKDNSTQNLVAEIKKEDSGKDVTFAGVYLTTQNAKGESVTVFKPLKNCEIDESELEWQTDSKNEKLETATVTLPNGKQVVVSRLQTDNGYSYDIPADMWLKTTDSNGNTEYLMQIKDVSSSMDAHFIFLKSPTVTYDANSTKDFEYEISDTNTTNVYTFKPDDSSGTVKYIDPVSSHDPVAPNDGWKFTGWKLFDTNGVVKYDNGNDVILSGTNAIACNTTQPNGQPTERRFIVVDGKKVQDAFNEGADVIDSKNAIIGKQWALKPGVTSVYEKESEALSLVAQWRFKNTFTPEYKDNVTDDKFTQGETGGTIELKNTADSENYIADPNGTKSYFAGVGEQVVATAKAKEFYTFIGWYDSEGNVVTTNPELVVNQVKGEIGKYHARFQKTGVSVNFYYLEYNKDTKSYEYKVYDGGKYTQYLNKNGIAKQPTGDSKKVKTWYTSRTNLGADTVFDFTKTLDKSIDLYAAPAPFTFNYLNQFQFAEPWRMITYATLKYDGKYIDMKNDPDVTDYKVYILKAGSVDEAQPTSKDIKENKKTQVVSKDQQGIMFNSTTKTGETFNRVGAQYNNQYIFDMKKPVWVTFEFTYRGITYTANVKNRSLYNNIYTYMKTTGQQYYTEYSEQQKAVLDAINKMYDATAKYKIPEATNYHSSVSVSNEVKNSVKYPEEGYTFNSLTTIRNIEPWGFKYSFSVNGKALSEYSDYGVVVLSDYEKAPTNAKELVNNEKAVMYSKSGKNIYDVENDANTAAAYHVNGITIANYDKSTYAVFFVRDSNGYHYSEVIKNSYKDIAEKDTSESSAVSKAILDYAQKYRTYVDAISKKNN